MAFDQKIMSRVLGDFEHKRAQRENDQIRRRNEIYMKIPRVAEIDAALKTSSIEIITSSLRTGTNPAPMLESKRAYNKKLQDEKRELIRQNSYPEDYLELKRDCAICDDSGFLADGVCSCLVRAYAEEQTKELSRLLPIQNQTFDTFSLNLYSSENDEEWGMSPRDNMATVLDTCKEFAAYFGSQTPNLLLCGSTGLGKTFLCSCIAGEVAAKGFSVIYDTAVNVFSTYEKDKFVRDADSAEEAAGEIERYHKCDLFILDDLGTELQGPFINTALYTLINTRLMSGRKMIINTNLSEERELPARYSKQIVSRLLGEFLVLPFFGDDIRLKRNEWY